MNKKQIYSYVEKLTQEFQEMGYNKPQSKSKAWADYFEQFHELKYGFYSSKRYGCYCSDCKTGRQFAAASSIHTFIELHRDHKTKTFAIN